MTTLVYFVREGDRNDELRFSIRSAEANLSASRVIIVGHTPRWLTGVTSIPGNPHGRDKARNVWANVVTACTHPDVPDEFVMMNDDFFILQPVEHLTHAYRGTLRDHIFGLGGRRDSWWGRSLRATFCYLRDAHGFEEPLSYELHRPMPVIKADMAQALAGADDYRPANPPQWRTLYGNLARVGGHQEADGKVSAPMPRDVPTTAPYLSSNEESFKSAALGGFIRKRFRTPSKWEA